MGKSNTRSTNTTQTNDVNSPASVRVSKARKLEDVAGFGSLYSEGDPEAGNSALRLGLAVSDRFHREPSEAFAPVGQPPAQSAYGGYRG